MIILPDGKPLGLENGIRSASVLVSKLGPELKSRCDAFLDSPACVYDYVETVHIVQGEIAEISLDKNVKVLGSSDATTCLIAVVLDHPSRRAVVYHHDESIVQLAESITHGILPRMQSPHIECEL